MANIVSGVAELFGNGHSLASFEQCYERNYFKERLASAAPESLFSWQTLNEVILRYRVEPPRLRFEHNHKDISSTVFARRRSRRGTLALELSPKGLHEALSSGATLIMDSVQDFSPALENLCFRLAQEFYAQVQTNLYACWGADEGFDVHWDDHDVFIVQVSGRKEWKLYGFAREHPTHVDFHNRNNRPSEPVAIETMIPGDVMYIPRGYWHAARGLGDPTMHLTIGVSQKTGQDFLHWLADLSVDQTLARRNVPLRAGVENLEMHIGSLLHLISDQDVPALASMYRRHLIALSRPPRAFQFPNLGRMADISVDAKYVMTHRLSEVCQGTDEGFTLAFGDLDLGIASSLEPFCRRLAAGESVSVGDTVAMDLLPEEAIRRFLSKMVTLGVIVHADA